MHISRATTIPLAAILITAFGCTFNTNPTAMGDNKPQNIVQVQLDKNGISSERFRDATRAPVIRPNQELTLATTETSSEFDVTFVIHTLLPEVQASLGTQETAGLEARFAQYLKTMARAYDVNCDLLPRCELTFILPPANALDRPSRITIPSQVVEFDAAEVTSFVVMHRRSPDTGWTEVPNRLGFVTSENKPASALLKVPLDNTGIADWGFLNPRNPRFLTVIDSKDSADSKDSTARKTSADLDVPELSQSTEDLVREATEAIEAIAKQKLRLRVSELADSFIACLLQRLPEKLSKEVASTLNRNLPEVGKPQCEALSAKATPPLAPTQDTETNYNLIREAAIQEIFYVVAGVTATTQESIDRTDRATLRLTSATTRTLRAIGQMVPQTVLPPVEPAEDKQAVQRVVDADKLLTSTRNEYTTAISSMRSIAEASADSSARTALSDLLANQAIERLEPLHKSALQQVGTLRASAERSILNQQRVRFDNRTLDRFFIVTFEVKKGDLLNGVTPSKPCVLPKNEEACQLQELQEDYGSSVSLTSSGEDSVTVTITVNPGSFAEVDAWLLSKAPKKIVPFEVDFFDQTDDPAYSQGYIALQKIDPGDAASQPESKLTTNVIGGFTSKNEPCLVDNESCDVTKLKLTASAPYTGDTMRHVDAKGQVDFLQSFGNRANAKLSLLYTKRDFGKKEDTVRLDQYQLNIFATNGSIFTYGNFTFAEPSNGIAISEKGDGLKLSLGPASISYVLRRESEAGSANDHDKDQEVIIGQWSKTLSRTPLLRRINIVGLYGEDKCKRDNVPSNDTNNGNCPATEEDTDTGASNAT